MDVEHYAYLGWEKKGSGKDEEREEGVPSFLIRITCSCNVNHTTISHDVVTTLIKIPAYTTIFVKLIQTLAHKMFLEIF
jgi:hypothetical protein